MHGSDAVAPETAAALLATIAEASGRPALGYASAPEPLTGGFDAELIRFELADPPVGLAGPLVARIPSHPGFAAWEAALQGNVAAQGFPTPAVRMVAGADGPLGRGVLVMDLVDGRPALDGLDGAAVITKVPSLIRRLPDQLAQLAAALHALDPEGATAELDALDSDIPTTVLGFLEGERALAASSGRRDLVAAAERLLLTEPPRPRRVITHGDLHPFNVLQTATGPVLIDWTVARVAHPGFTLGFTDLLLSHPPVAMPSALEPGLRAVGRRLARRFHRTYRALAAPEDLVTDDELDWFRRVHALRSVVELAHWTAAGTRPRDHPWVHLEPVAHRLLGLSDPVAAAPAAR